MRPMRRLGAIALITLAACSVGRPADDATGEEIFTQLCSNCHGADLSGGIAAPLGPGSNSASRPDEFLEISIMHGRGRMPSFSSSLTERQLRLLIDFIRDRQGG